MAEQMKEIDIEQIMDEIRADIQKRGYKDEDIDFENLTGNVKATLGVKTDFSAYEFSHALTDSCNAHKIEYYRMIPKGGLKSFIQRFIRKMVKFMMVPMVDQQNRYNYQMVVCMRQMEAFIEEHKQQMEQKEQQIDGLEEQIFNLNKRCEVLESQLKGKEV